MNKYVEIGLIVATLFLACYRLSFELKRTGKLFNTIILGGLILFNAGVLGVMLQLQFRIESNTISSLSVGDYRVLYTNFGDIPPEYIEGKEDDYQLFAIIRGYDESPGRSTKVALQKRLPRCFHVGKDHEILGLKCPDESQIAESE